jgi:hypothetical protein
MRAWLRRLDPEVYLGDVFRVLSHWPRDRFLELAPRYWRITRARLDRGELDRKVGWLTIPERRDPRAALTRTVGADSIPPATPGTASAYALRTRPHCPTRQASWCVVHDQSRRTRHWQEHTV